MLEWMLGLLIVAALIAKIFESFDLLDFDLFDVIGGFLKLVASLLLAATAFIVYLTTRRSPEKKSS